MSLSEKFGTCLVLLLIAGLNLSCGLAPGLPSLREEVLKDREEKTQRTKQAISKSPRLKSVDDFCTNIAKPTDFTLAFKTYLMDNGDGRGAILVTHQYASKTAFKDVKAFFSNSLTSDGWSLEEEVDIGGQWVDYKKDNRLIQIYYNGGSERIYGITCQKSFGGENE